MRLDQEKKHIHRGIINKFRFLLLVSGLFAYSLVNAQGQEKRFGNIDKSVFSATACSFDSSASACYLFDTGDLLFSFDKSTIKIDDYESQKSIISYKFSRHFRIQVFDEDGISQRRIVISLPIGIRGQDYMMNSFNAATYNLVNGEIIKTKFPFSEVQKHVAGTTIYYSFEMPEVKAGSVIDVDYTFTSDAYQFLPDWNFQQEIPVVYSDFEFYLPDFMFYNIRTRGVLEPLHETKQSAGSFTLTYNISDAGFQDQLYEKTTNFILNEHTYKLENVFAFSDSSYVRSCKAMCTGMEFELRKVHFAGEMDLSTEPEWSAIARDMILEQGLEVDLSTPMVYLPFTSKMDKTLQGEGAMKAAVLAVHQGIKWDGYLTAFKTADLPLIKQAGTGNIAEINYSLVSVLRGLGFKSYPLAISTRVNGSISADQPSSGGFDAILALVIYNGRNYVLDAVSGITNLRYLPYDFCNGAGLILDPDTTGWVDLMNGQSFMKQTDAMLAVDTSGNLSGYVTSTYYQYAAVLKEISSEESGLPAREKRKCDSYETPVFKRYAEREYTDAELSTLKETAKVTVKNVVNMQDPEIRIQALPLNEITYQLSEPERKIPIEFEYSEMRLYSVKITVPDGYSVKSLPSPALISLQGKAAKFTYSATLTGNIITVSCTFNLSKTMYNPPEYGDIKNFLSAVHAIISGKIVLTKNA
jgi:hypothetical protein